MESNDLYTELDRIVTKPAPFSVYTAEALWADPHTSEQMLAFHLNPDIDVSSRRTTFINESVEWMVGHFGLSTESRVIDFGCGPGLYASRFASCGVSVTGVDFSPTSIAYAQKQAVASGQQISFEEANYLEYKPDGKFDLITMIMCDFCALSPFQRSIMLRKFTDSLSDKGRLVLDVYSLLAYEQKQEAALFEKNLLNGFWSSSPYYGFLVSFNYETERVSLDKYTIVEESKTNEVYNWLQYYSPESLEKELLEYGLVVESVLGDVAGHQFDPLGTEFAIVAKMA
jgi:cyclopropane fatty-acyl-phospholipid synthase-like methyltransferase